ncbi:PIN domain-containing protein [Geodermatophilus sp. YIM 151500]|uniref:TA system VapC family ribonuclease toxin n=1 Tax=Geodermatophilus sp. YIM 151500 TaxID=2984531 RepID=UPI0021E3A099|nr:TA system VapC family ribonuclease toxin [Geodermatophilus sp. YIM 151500]MCV2488234.1 PIN domain-containing protein [Geodermatophilus sp. YIM 151500]
MLVDASVLLYAVDERARAHAAARDWLEGALNGSRRVGLPWQSLIAFVRIVTHPRALPAPLAPAEAWAFVTDWLEAPAAWVPEPGRGYRDILGQLVSDLDLRGNLVTDAALAALALEHGLAVVSADSDFARFPGLTWINPVAP